MHWPSRSSTLRGTARIRPAIPLQYASKAWDIAWVMVRTDGATFFRHVDPHTLKFDDSKGRYAMRWFVR